MMARQSEENPERPRGPDARLTHRPAYTARSRAISSAGVLVFNVEQVDQRLPECLNTLSPDHLRDAYALEVALASMPVGISWARVEDRQIIFTNRKFRELFGYTEKDFTDITDWIDRAYPYPEDRDLARKTWGEYFLHPKRHEVSLEPIEIRVLCKDGEIKNVIVSGVILPETGWALATIVDITEMKRNEADLKAAKRQALENQTIYQTLLDHSPECWSSPPSKPEGVTSHRQ